MFGLILLLLIVLPVAELYLLSTVASSLGWLPSILILISISILGGLLLKFQTASVVAKAISKFTSGSMPSKELADSAILIFASALLLTPGFLTDAFGLAMFIPPFRAVVRKALLTEISRRALSATRKATSSAQNRFGFRVASMGGEPFDVNEVFKNANTDDPIDVDSVAVDDVEDDIEEVHITRTKLSPTEIQPGTVND